MRAAEAAGVLGTAMLLGLIVARRVAETTVVNASGSEPPSDESRGTNKPA